MCRRVALLRTLRSVLCCGLWMLSMAPLAAETDRDAPSCLPADSEALMSRADGAPLLCFRSHDHRNGRCWSLDTRRNTWKPFQSSLIPGYSLIGDACRQWGYCMPPVPVAEGEDRSADDLVVLSLDRKSVAVITRPFRLVNGEIAVFELNTVNAESGKPESTRLLRRFSYQNPPDGGGIGNRPREAVLTGELLFVAGQDAGPATYVTRIPLRGGGFETIDYPSGQVFNMDEGLLRLLNDREVIIRNRGYVELTVAASRTETRIRKLPWPASCSAAQFRYASAHLSGYRPEDRDSLAAPHVGKSCAAALGRLIRGYWDAGSFHDDGKQYVLENVRGELRLMFRTATDGKRTLISRLPRCRKALLD